MTIAITGPTGHIGSQLVRRLLDAGADLRLLLRNPDKLDPSVRSRVRIEVGELQDEAFVKRATEGVESLFWLTPSDSTTPDLGAWYERIGKTAASAVRANRIRNVVNISSAGAQVPNAGPVSGLGQVERHLNQTDANIIHLRPGFFFENMLMQLDSLRSQGAIFQPARGDVPLPQIATRDIAEVAARLLLQADGTGKHIRGLHGPAHLTFDESAHIIGEAIGRPVRYVSINEEQARQALSAAGMGPAFVQAYLDMEEALVQPGAIAEPRTPETTTPTTLFDWATEVLKPLITG